jgi:UDP-2,3-diacylglucosamine pyrophosphatase LpxH
MSVPSKSELTRLYNECNGNITSVARQLGRSRTTVHDWCRKIGLEGKGKAKLFTPELEEEINKPEINLPVFPDDDIAVEDIIETMCRRHEKRQEFQNSKQWFEVKVNVDGPIGVAFIGDPHVDDDGCNWPLLRQHCELLRDTEKMFAINIGDTQNNWTGRLTKLFAQQETSQKTAIKLAEWLLKDAGIDWLVWLMGNHDMWGELSQIFREMNVEKIPMEDWQARFVLKFPNDRECKIWAAHDFKGHSMWNSLHAPQKAAHMKSEAHIYACGHTHNWAMHQEESASRDFVYWLIRARGYKFIDEYADLLGHFPQKEGATITCIIDPDAKSEAGFVQAFVDLEEACDYLTWKRRSFE